MSTGALLARALHAGLLKTLASTPPELSLCGALRMDAADGSTSFTRKRGDPRYSPPKKDSPEAKGVRFA